MNKIVCLLLFILPGLVPVAHAQKTFDEGTIVYHVTFTYPGYGAKSVEGTYIFTVKGKMLRKELQLGNGYDDVTIINGDDNSSYTLQTIEGKKYAIQHNVEEHLAAQKKYEGFTLKDEADKKDVGGYAAQKAQITYTSGVGTPIYYTNDWHPAYDHLFYELPGATFMPLEFNIVQDGAQIHFTIEKIELKPIESLYFRIPQDYKMISSAEYKELKK